MSLVSRTEDLVTWSAFFAFVMVILSIVSLVTMVSYLAWEEVEAWYSVGACMVGMFILLIILSFSTIPTAMRVAKESGSRNSLRALYIYILLPILFIGVMVGNSANYFLNVLIFGWPLFLVSAVLLVQAAYWMKEEVNVLSFNVRCGFCKTEFVMMQDSLVGFCDYCGARNWNPLKPQDGESIKKALAYQPTTLTTHAYGGRNPERDHVVTVMMFLVVTSGLAVAGGVFILFVAWDAFEIVMGLAFLGTGVFGLIASFMIPKLASFFVPLLASTLLLIMAFVGFILFDICGIAIGGFAIFAFFFSFQLWMSRKRGRKIRVPVGTVKERPDGPPRH